MRVCAGVWTHPTRQKCAPFVNVQVPARGAVVASGAATGGAYIWGVVAGALSGATAPEGAGWSPTVGFGAGAPATAVCCVAATPCATFAWFGAAATWGAPNGWPCAPPGAAGVVKAAGSVKTSSKGLSNVKSISDADLTRFPLRRFGARNFGPHDGCRSRCAG